MHAAERQSERSRRYRALSGGDNASKMNIAELQRMCFRAGDVVIRRCFGSAFVLYQDVSDVFTSCAMPCIHATNQTKMSACQCHATSSACLRSHVCLYEIVCVCVYVCTITSKQAFIKRNNYDITMLHHV